jgi:hypothetical protein
MPVGQNQPKAGIFESNFSAKIHKIPTRNLINKRTLFRPSRIPVILRFLDVFDSAFGHQCPNNRIVTARCKRYRAIAD